MHVSDKYERSEQLSRGDLYQCRYSRRILEILGDVYHLISRGDVNLRKDDQTELQLKFYENKLFSLEREQNNGQRESLAG